MKIYGFEKFSMVDYEKKISCTVFTRGCNFRCPFCQNSSLVLPMAQPKEIDEEQVFTYLAERRHLVDAVCVTGGEPTMQPDLPIFLRRVKDMGFLTKLDTNGTNPTMLMQLISDGLLDYVAMDIKNSPENYAKIIGFDTFDIAKVKRSVDILLQGKVDYEFRTTLVKQFHTEKDFVSIGKFVVGAKRYFLQKFADSGDCIENNLEEVPKQQATKLKDILIDSGIADAQLRGY
ncbi:MAG: anaerobic ribonucleoside-triphosphate reductase activating protein [Clostridia bacterium]